MKIYTLQGSYVFKNQKYTLNDGSSSDYLTLRGGFEYGHYSPSLCDVLEEWSDDLPYEKTSKLLSQLTGTVVFSSTGISHYLEQKAAFISQKWVAEAHTEIKQIAVSSHIGLYDSASREVILMMDDVGVKAQKPHKQKEREPSDAKRLDTTVILVQDREKNYHHATSGMDNAGKTIYSVEQAIIDSVANLHNIAEALPIVAITDGARSIRCVLHTIFGTNVCIILDWYHLQLKVKNLMSMIALNKADKELFINDLKLLLWTGNSAEAITYLDNMTSVRNAIKHKELRDYIEKHEAEIIDYGLRKKAEKTIGSGRAEKANDLVVAHRQKKKGMAWSRKGSSALAIIKTHRLNRNLSKKLATDLVH